MMKYIIKDYFVAFRWGKIKESYKSGGWWMYFYLLTLLPAITGFYDRAKDAACYLLVGVPIVFCLFSAPLHPMRLPKIMYLCPMDEKARRSYIEKSGYFRMAFSVLLGIIGALVLIVGGMCDWICGVGLVFNMVVLALFSCGINANGYGTTDANGNRTFDTSDARGVLEMWGIIITLISSLGYVAMLAWETTVAVWVKGIFIGVAVLIQLPIFLKYLTYWEGAVERAMNYERSYIENKK